MQQLFGFNDGLRDTDLLPRHQLSLDVSEIHQSEDQLSQQREAEPTNYVKRKRRAWNGVELNYRGQLEG